MATGTITSLGIGSSLDLQNILETLRTSDESSINSKKKEKTNLEKTKNQFNSINAKLLTMKSNALSLSLNSSFLERSISVSSSNVLSANTSLGTKIGSYSAVVNRLTTANSFQSIAVANKTDSIASSQSNFSYIMGSSDKISLTITKNTTLESLVKQINSDKNNPGVTASIIDTGSGNTPYKLLLKANKAGESSRITIAEQLNDLTLTELNGTGFKMEGDTKRYFATITSSNKDIVFKENNGSNIIASITQGNYQTQSDLAVAVKKALNQASTNNGNYEVSYNSSNNKFEIYETGNLSKVTFDWNNSNSTAEDVLGFTAIADDVLKPSSGISKFVSSATMEKTDSVYVPTIQKSTNGFNNTDTTTALSSGKKIEIKFSESGATPKSFVINATSDMSLNQLVTAINQDTTNDTGSNSTHITASTFEKNGKYYLQIAATDSNGTGEDYRVKVTDTDNSFNGFAADNATFAFKVGNSNVSISITADTTLQSLKDLIDAKDNVSASLSGTAENSTLEIIADSSGISNRITMIKQLNDITMQEDNPEDFVATSDDAKYFSTISSSNNKIIFAEDNGSGYGSDITATIASNNYETQEKLAKAVEKAFNDASKASGNSKEYSVIFNSKSDKFEITEPSGTLTGLKIKWDADGTKAEGELGFGTSEKILTPKTASLNSSITIDGIEYQREKNSGISDVINGVTFSLIGKGNSSISVTQKTDTIKGYITKLVTTFNDISTEIDANDNYDEDTETWGPLAKATSIRSLKTNLLSLFGTQVSANKNITTYFDLGFETNKDGKININTDVLDNKINSNFEDVLSFFAGTQDSNYNTKVTGIGDIFNDFINSYTKSTGIIKEENNIIDDKINRIEDQIDNDTQRLNQRYETMTQQFVKLDSFMRKIESQQNYITQIFNTSNNKKK